MVHGTPFFVSVLAPIILVLLINHSILISIIAQIQKRRAKKHEKSNFKPLVIDARNSFVVNSLFGLTWVLTLFALSDLTMVFQWLFCIANSLQGFFIFIFYIIRDKEVWNIWVMFYSTKRNQNQMLNLRWPLKEKEVWLTCF